MFPEAVGFGCWNRSGDLIRHALEVIVDRSCGAAVLRGAHVFVPGVIGLLPGNFSKEMLASIVFIQSIQSIQSILIFLCFFFFQGACEGDIVSIYADVSGVTKRGWTRKLDEKYRMFVGNGILLMGRKQIFCENGTSR